MNNFEDIVTEIYIQIAKFTNTDKDPYYLFISLFIKMNKIMNQRVQC